MENPSQQYPETQHQFPPPPQEIKKRPGMLNVLCILTFIGSGLSILAILFSMVITNFVGDLPGAENTPDPSYIAIFGGMIMAAGKLVGAGLMYKLRKPGFLAYTICELGALGLGIMETIRTYGMGGNEETFAAAGLPENFTGIIQIASIVISGILSIVFISLYASQTKHMS